MVASDRLKVRQIALNLGMNAVKYTQSGLISLRFARHDAECWMLEVCHTGPEIPRKSRESIFESFNVCPRPVLISPVPDWVSRSCDALLNC